MNHHGDIRSGKNDHKIQMSSFFGVESDEEALSPHLGLQVVWWTCFGEHCPELQNLAIRKRWKIHIMQIKR
ncbi:hypothetical protein Nepgr_011118 [Nepenthes gracilis]|uniref:Uncharacterized protein n=1 Tax=Nepenthes gracilis TaxID=150966 RepID=A0AAD3SDS5_NEPGR|nr:hypothetical protein Nepgr_011118 [Nepenthes gracilis]